MAAITKDQIIEVLKTVEDPEIRMDLWFLGLIYDIRTDGSSVEIDMTLTSPMCPLGPDMIDEIKAKVSDLDGVDKVEVRLVFSPPWEPSDDVKVTLGLL